MNEWRAKIETEYTNRLRVEFGNGNTHGHRERDATVEDVSSWFKAQSKEDQRRILDELFFVPTMAEAQVVVARAEKAEADRDRWRSQPAFKNAFDDAEYLPANAHVAPIHQLRSEYEALRIKLQEATDAVKQLRTKLAVCGEFALGGPKYECNQGDVRWSPSLDDVKSLYARYVRRGEDLTIAIMRAVSAEATLVKVQNLIKVSTEPSP